MKFGSNALLAAVVVGLSGAVVLAGCSSTSDAGSSEEGLVPSPTDTTEGSGSAGKDALEAAGLSTVYFDFDSYVLTSESRDSLRKAAESLKTNSAARIQIEGHCDERGSNEYNLALGEKRARAVEEFLVNQGVSADQLSTISYGEERPAVPGSDEDSWAKNRRAEFVGL